MKKFNMKNSFLFVVLVISALACLERNDSGSRSKTLPYYNEMTFTPHWLEPESAVLDTFHKVSSFTLINQNGDTITEKNFDDKIYVVDFFFTTCPGICPRMTNNMKILQDEFIDDSDVLLLSHSVTPEYDSVPVLKEYAENKGILVDTWHLVYGRSRRDL